MELWQKQLLILLASIGWLLSLIIVVYMASYYLDAANPLRKEAVLGVTIPIIYGSPIWIGLLVLLLRKRNFITKRERNISVIPLLIALGGFAWSLSIQ